MRKRWRSEWMSLGLLRRGLAWGSPSRSGKVLASKLAGGVRSAAVNLGPLLSELKLAHLTERR
jgi:hypothetical protein